MVSDLEAEIASIRTLIGAVRSASAEGQKLKTEIRELVKQHRRLLAQSLSAAERLGDAMPFRAPPDRDG